MPKELTHIHIALQVLARLRASCSSPLLQTLEKHRSAYCLGAVIPDAFFYNLIPWPRLPKGLPTVSRALHHKDGPKNERRAEGLFSAISSKDDARARQAAFVAGIVTHTVSDRFVHGIIDHYTNLWGEAGKKAIGTHRQFETLLDVALLDADGIPYLDFPLDEAVALSPRETRRLLSFAVSSLVPRDDPPPPGHVQAFHWAHRQQLLLLRLFRRPVACQAALGLNRLTAGRLGFVSGLFYPPVSSPKAFPLLERISMHCLADGDRFRGDIAALVHGIVEQACRIIRRGFDRLG